MRYSDLIEGVKPAIFYHGSDHEIVSFSLDYLSSGKGYDQHGPGIYLTSSKEDAKKYGKYIYEVKVSIPKSRLLGKKRTIKRGIEILIRKSPDRDENLMNWDENPKIGFYKAVEGIMQSYPDDYREACEQVWYDFYSNNSADYLRQMIRFGYDGFQLNKADGITHLVVFNPETLKIVSKSERVIESFSPSVSWEWIQTRNFECVAKFEINDLLYTVTMFKYDSTIDGWEFSFTVENDEKDYGTRASKTGNVWKVFGTVIDIARDFIKIKQPKVIKIESDISERNRYAVNKRIADLIAKDTGYKINIEIDEDAWKQIFLYRD